MSISKEKPSYFMDFVPTRESMSPQAAIEVLASFHGATEAAVLDAFMNLRGFTQGTVEFRESRNNGNPCMVMEGKHPNGVWAWNHLIDQWSGQPQMRCS